MVRIVSTGNTTAKVFDENGNEINGVSAVEIDMKPKHIHTAKITILPCSIDISARAEFVYEQYPLSYDDKKYFKALGIIAMLALMLFIWKFNGSL